MEIYQTLDGFCQFLKNKLSQNFEIISSNVEIKMAILKIDYLVEQEVEAKKKLISKIIIKI